MENPFVQRNVDNPFLQRDVENRFLQRDVAKSGLDAASRSRGHGADVVITHVIK